MQKVEQIITNAYSVGGGSASLYLQYCHQLLTDTNSLSTLGPVPGVPASTNSAITQAIADYTRGASECVQGVSSPIDSTVNEAEQTDLNNAYNLLNNLPMEAAPIPSTSEVALSTYLATLSSDISTAQSAISNGASNPEIIADCSQVQDAAANLYSGDVVQPADMTTDQWSQVKQAVSLDEDGASSCQGGASGSFSGNGNSESMAQANTDWSQASSLLSSVNSPVPTTTTAPTVATSPQSTVPGASSVQPGTCGGVNQYLPACEGTAG